MWKGGWGRKRKMQKGLMALKGGNLQNSEFAGLEREDWKEEEADHKADGGAQVTGAKDEHPIPTTH